MTCLGGVGLRIMNSVAGGLNSLNALYFRNVLTGKSYQELANCHITMYTCLHTFCIFFILY